MYQSARPLKARQFNATRVVQCGAHAATWWTCSWNSTPQSGTLSWEWPSLRHRIPRFKQYRVIRALLKVGTIWMHPASWQQRKRLHYKTHQNAVHHIPIVQRTVTMSQPSLGIQVGQHHSHANTRQWLVAGWLHFDPSI